MPQKKVLITGGCGFIGTNAADYFSSQGWVVTVVDNLSRKGAVANLAWLQEKHPAIRFIHADIRADREVLKAEIKPVDAIIHLASQVAVTLSWKNPHEDFDINAGGTLNVLETIRALGVNPILIYASTNKVYGGLEDVTVEESATRYSFKGLPQGIAENQSLDFHSPYGCSKGAGDQYVRDYARMYNLRTVVLRQSCIYGPHQHGVSDQGWLAWFMIAAAAGQPITIYGNGKQCRDILYVTDLVRAYQAAIDRITVAKGQVFNIGGGPNSALSVLELLHYIKEKFGYSLSYVFEEARPGDQLCYISNTQKTKHVLSWQPQVAPTEGLKLLADWVGLHERQRAYHNSGL